MAWITFESIEKKDDLVSKAGNKYSAWVLRGTKRGYKADPDTQYEKILFENRAVTVIEKGIERPGISIVQFFLNGCKPGDLVILKSVQKNGRWEIESVENRAYTNAAADYEPLDAAEINAMKAAAPQMVADPTRPAAPKTPFMAPVKYAPAM